MRDPDGYLIEVGRYTQLALDHFKQYAYGPRGQIRAGALENRETEV